MDNIPLGPTHRGGIPVKKCERPSDCPRLSQELARVNVEAERRPFRKSCFAAEGKRTRALRQGMQRFLLPHRTSPKEMSSKNCYVTKGIFFQGTTLNSPYITRLCLRTVEKVPNRKKVFFTSSTLIKGYTIFVL